MERHTEYHKELENEDKVYEITSVDFTAANPETKTLQLSPPAGKVWHLDIIKAWTDEAPPDNTNVGSLTDLDIYINGTTKKVAKSYASDMIGITYRTCGIAFHCQQKLGQRLKITETVNGVYVTATKTGTGTHKLWLSVEGTAI